MAACDQVKLLLGPFDDGELEPHEMEDVALHIVCCGACKAALDDYRSLGVALRDCLPQPTIDGFSAAVLKRIEQIPQPWWPRWRAYVDMLGERVGGTASLIAAGAFAAVLTSWLVTPYVHRLVHPSSHINELASRNPNDLTGPTPQTVGVRPSTPSDLSESSMVALSDDPTTTVIWLPNQP
jgi:anti-sigma factor RsiW